MSSFILIINTRKENYHLSFRIEIVSSRKKGVHA